VGLSKALKASQPVVAALPWEWWISGSPAALETTGPRLSFSDTNKSNSEGRIHSTRTVKFRRSLQESVLKWAIFSTRECGKLQMIPD